MTQERVKAFESAERHDPSATIKTKEGTFFVYLSKISNIVPDFRPYFPYGIKSIPRNGSLPNMYLSFTAEMDGKIDDPDGRKHYLFFLYLPGINSPFLAGDIFHFGSGELKFECFYNGKPKRKISPAWKIVIPNNDDFGEGGLITIPDNLSLVRKIEVSVAEISQEEWKKGPWFYTELSSKLQRSFFQEMEKY